VGVNKGTPELYEAFPEAYHVLIEPLKENEPHLQRILQEYEGEYFLTAVGARDEVLTINVQAGGDRQKSSLLNRTDEYKLDPALERREVPVTTLDGLLEKHKFEPPFGLKVDTEGFDYQVIEGASNFLRDTQFVIAEVNVAKIYEGSYTFADFIRIMDEHGFYLCDILRVGRQKLPPFDINFVDAMFLKANLAAVATQES
jgi:FkbM family methyltransferase